MENKISESELEKINSYTRRPMSPDELYTFSVMLCDNSVDRDNERFTADALGALAELFKGKTGIFDHNHTAGNQQARIYDTYVETDTRRTVADGEMYTRLIGKAYMPRSEKSGELMLDIDSGIKKEVSVGCAVRSRKCSICGKERAQGCKHEKGRRYDGKLCFDILSEPTDAYEWSFVAVPAQKEAGVIKHLDGSISSAIEKSGSKLIFEGEAIRQLKEKAAELERLSTLGQRYTEMLKRRAITLKSLCNQSCITESIIDKMTAAELEELNRELTEQAGKMYPIRPQLWAEKSDSSSCNQFKI